MVLNLRGVASWLKFVDDKYEYDKRTREYYPLTYYKCSMCGEEVIRKKTKYCPNCKRRMFGFKK